MRILAISNLFPRPDQPSRGIFNLQLFSAMADIVRRDGGSIETIVPVAEWRIHRHAEIARWQPPANIPPALNVHYLPYFYLPLVGRSAGVAFMRNALKAESGMAAHADVVFAAWLYPDGVAVVDWLAESGKSAGILVQGSDLQHLQSSVRRRQILQALNRDVQLFCVWNGLADRLVEAGVRKDKIKVTPNGIDGTRFQYRTKEAARAALIERGACKVEGVEIRTSDHGKIFSPFHLSPSTRLVLFVGNLVPVKGPERLIQAFAKFLKEYKVQSGMWNVVCESWQPSTRQPHNQQLLLVMIGDGPMRPALESMAKQAGIFDHVLFLGRRPHEEIPLWMNAADVLCLSSRSEGHPNVVSEALASGLPVIATDVGAVRELLQGESAARVLVDDDSLVGRMAESLAALMEHVGDRAALAQRHSNRTWSAMADEILQGF